MNLGSSLYVFYGDDEYQVTTQARKRVDTLVPEAERMMSLETIEGRTDASEKALQILQQTLMALKTPSFFGGRRVVWLKDATFFADKSGSWSDEVKGLIQELAEYLQKGLGDTHAFVLTAPKIDGRQKFLKVCQSVGKVEEFSIPEQSWSADKQMKPFIADEFRKQKLNAEEEVVERFLEKVGADPRQAVNEIEKMALWLGDRTTVTLEDVETVVAPTRKRMAWDLADAFAAKKLTQALVLLKQLLAQKCPEILLISQLNDRVNDLLLYREGMDRGWIRVGNGPKAFVQWKSPLAPELEEALGAGHFKDPRKIHPYRASLLAQQARGWGREELETARRLTMNVYEQLVSSGISSDLLISFLLIRTLRRASLPSARP